mmetsp:Transcript_54363/g.90200  ORF Transcript_54363/g.90200 Transcript_54363/m.90200 type:complete len:244 (+) Transcript_54363:114-845(+)
MDAFAAATSDEELHLNNLAEELLVKVGCSLHLQARCRCRQLSRAWQRRIDSLGIPLLFHGFVGKDMREAYSSAWFNPEECVQVFRYVSALLALRRLPNDIVPNYLHFLLEDILHENIQPKDIGVITFYTKQAQRIKRICAKNGFNVSADGIKIGTPDFFQGEERKVILISTVHSSEDWIDFIPWHNHLQWENYLRMCTLLVVVGNPRVLWHDQHSRVLLQRARSELGVYTGVPPPAEENGTRV